MKDMRRQVNWIEASIKREAAGFPKQTSGWEAAFPLQGAGVQSLVGEKKIPHAVGCGQK